MKTWRVRYLHGFLGSPLDGDPFLRALQASVGGDFNNEIQFESLDLYELIRHHGIDSWVSLCELLIQQREKQNQGSLLLETTRNVWIGYSMGARLLLTMLEENSDDLFVFISCHPGLRSEGEKNQRLIDDQQRAQELRNLQHEEHWKRWIENWNKQPVLAPALAPTALQLDRWKYKTEVASSIDLFSLGRQKDYSELLHTQCPRYMWIVGSEDAKFKDLAHSLQPVQTPLNLCEIEGAGHRIPLTHPSLLAESVARFLNQSRS